MKEYCYHKISNYMQSLDINYADSGFYYSNRRLCELYVEGESYRITDCLNNFTRSMCKLGLQS